MDIGDLENGDLAPVHKQSPLWERKDYVILQPYQVIQPWLISGNKSDWRHVVSTFLNYCKQSVEA